MSADATFARVRRRLTAGVEVQPDGGAHARVWAPSCRAVDLVIDAGGAAHPLERETDGYFTGSIPNLSDGTRYWYRLDGGALRPDPVSRWQPDGPHGPSAVIDPSLFCWTDDGWRGLERHGQVIYEMHLGTFTADGTWASAAAELPALAELGITTIELMPVADFAGRFGWGYDGVNLYAPTHLYGTPDDFRHFVDRAHGLGLAVILDVVYNHVGPDGNYLEEFSPDYFTDKYKNDWGRAINFEGPAAARQFFVENAGYWIDEFHLDGLRLDATQDIHDESPEHVLAAVVRQAREAARARRIFIVAENEPQDTRLVRPPDRGGYGIDALWNDDYHHTALVAMTGHREAYYSDYAGSAQELISCAKYGYLYQGQWYGWQKQRRGAPALDLNGDVFVSYLENHDQLANSAFGRRTHQLTSPGRHRALTALTLLGPATPMLFQGQEFAASTPFLYFADHNRDLRGPVRQGRREFLEQFPSVTDPELAASLPSPVAKATFVRCKLDLGEREAHAAAYALHRDLLRVRAEDPVIRSACRRRPDAAVLAAGAFVLRFFGDENGDRLLVVNLGADLDLAICPEPLLAPPLDRAWSVAWSSEAVRYGGQGTPPIGADAAWHIPGEAAVLLRSEFGHADGAHESA